MRSLALTLLATLAITAAFPTQADEIVLRRYTPVDAYAGFSDDLKHGEKYTYMDAEDTFLSAAKPDVCFGGAGTLVVAAPDDAILLAFKQLNRAVPVGSTVNEVALTLFPDGEVDQNATIEVYRVTKPWRDGYADGAQQNWATTFANRFTGDAAHVRPWTKPGGRADCAEQPSFAGKLADCWKAEQKAFVLAGPGLVQDVQFWLGKHYRNYGWMIVVKAGTPLKGKVAFVSSDVLENGDPALSHKPALRITYVLKKLAELKKPDRADLDVTYIERTPRYTRYHDNDSYERKMFRGDNVGILKKPDYADEQKWPKDGDTVKYTAHVKNAGSQPAKGPVAYRWLLNDKVVAEGKFDGELAPWAEWTATWEWKWAVDHRDHRNLLLEFEVDPQDQVTEITKNNNLVAKYLGAKVLKYWVEQGAYDYVKDFPTALGSYSFEDYLQWHFTIWNDTYFDKSRFDGVARDGCLERTSLDGFGIVENGVLAGGIHRPYDKWDAQFDGEWGTEWDAGGSRMDAKAVEQGVKERMRDGKKDEATARAEYEKWAKQADENDKHFLRTRRVVLEGSLLHEASHQTVGAYDIYWSNIEASEPDKPIGKCKVKDETGKYITRGSWYTYAGLMGGSDTRPNPQYWEGTGLYSLNTVGGVNTDLAFRNGFYGDWQYDLPRACYVKLTSLDGQRLSGAKVTLWQSHSNSIDETSQVAKDVAADADGVLMLPYQDSLEPADYTTITGHTFLKQNPFGRPDVVGENITLLLQVNANGQRDYQFVRVTDYNTLFWLGQKEKATLPLACRISPSDKIDLTKNLAEGATVRASGGTESCAKLVDGDVATNWDGGNAKPGDWVEIELPQAARVGVIRIVQDSGHGAFYRRFRITTRGAAADAKSAPFAAQGGEPFTAAMANDKDVNNARPSEKWVTYAATPRETKVVRIEALDGGGVHVSEIRVYGEK